MRQTFYGGDAFNNVFGSLLMEIGAFNGDRKSFGHLASKRLSDLLLIGARWRSHKQIVNI